ncbi:hypothetical protein BT67DRAFT_438708 [Trichocladium antarcticum]|uniref:Uncharacterized protein n=1 Tax=Trichocladium antarcticum TaxID=1450529 RepID=A0AAN6URC1_9PEZI|nr:hypothetical protein BT67DRAFT_438708 [Trichocladium antarcticum]
MPRPPPRRILAQTPLPPSRLGRPQLLWLRRLHAGTRPPTPSQPPRRHPHPQPARGIHFDLWLVTTTTTATIAAAGTACVVLGRRTPPAAAM